MSDGKRTGSGEETSKIDAQRNGTVRRCQSLAHHGSFGGHSQSLVPSARPTQNVDFGNFLTSSRLDVDGQWLLLPLSEKTVRDFGLKDGIQIFLGEKPKEVVAKSIPVPRSVTTIVKPKMPTTAPSRSSAKQVNRDLARAGQAIFKWTNFDQNVSHKITDGMHAPKAGRRTQLKRSKKLTKADP